MLDTRTIRIETKSSNINTILSRIEHNEILFTLEFQSFRDFWTETHQSRFIETLILHIPTPAFYFDSISKGKDIGKWNIVDGLQRLTAIQRFVIDKTLRLCDLKYLKDYEGKRFNDLPYRIQRIIREADIFYHIIMPGTPHRIKLGIFRQVNNMDK